MGKKITKEYLEHEYVTCEKSQRQISQELGVSQALICRYFKKFGIEVPDARRSRPRFGKRPTAPGKKWLITEYVYRKKSQAKIASELGVAQKTVGKWMEMYGIPARDSGGPVTKHPLPREQLEWEYITNGKSIRQIALDYGVGRKTVAKWMKECGIHTKNRGAYSITPPSKKWLITEYVRRKRLQAQIAEELGVSQSTVCNWLKEYGIRARSRNSREYREDTV